MNYMDWVLFFIIIINFIFFGVGMGDVGIYTGA